MSTTLGTPQGELLVSDEPCLGVPMFTLAESPEQDPLLLLNRRLYLIEARLQQLEDARLSARLSRGWRQVRRQLQRGWAAVVRFSQRVRG